MADNYLLHNGASTKGITVTNATGLHGLSTRGSLETSPNEVGWLRGDYVDVVSPISCQLLVTADSESAAVTELRSIVAFAEDAEYLQRTDQGSWRALHGSGLSLLSFNPNVIPGGVSGQWLGEITFMPMFALWTTSQIRTLAEYEAALDTGSEYVYVSTGLWIETELTDGAQVHP